MIADNQLFMNFDITRRRSRVIKVHKTPSEGELSLKIIAYIIHSGFISGYQNRYGDNLKPPTNVYHRMTA